MPTNPTSFILRFRDLSTGVGDTIKLHRQLIESKGAVWWGWWHKSGEQVPGAALGALLKGHKSGIPILLFDSGLQQLYRATVATVHWNNLQNLELSPDPESTPAYYRDNPYLAWFKLTSIDETPLAIEELKGLAYVQVNELFDANDSKFLPFYNKQIFSPGELKQQERTIWFTRPLEDTDAINEVSLLDARRLSPSDFPEAVTISSSRTLVWLSDAHFSDDSHHAFPLVKEEAQNPMWLAVVEALKRNGPEDVAGLLASGDFAWKAQRSEFDEATRSLGNLSRTLSLEPYDQLFCPGNHDVAFTSDPSNIGATITRNSAEATAEYRRFYKNAFSKEPNEFISSGRRFLFGRSTAVDIVSLNSNLLQQTAKVFQGHGFVGQSQLEDAAAQMGWMGVEEEPPLRVLMLHHHLLPVTFRDQPSAEANYSVVLDAEAIVRWIVEHRVKVVLHGHMHQPFVTKITRHIDLRDPDGGMHEFWVLGIGSAGVVSTHLGEVSRHTIGTLTFYQNTLRFDVLAIHPTNPSEPIYGLDLPLV